MSEFHDERSALPIEQGVLLWCMRVWVMDSLQPIGAECRILEVMARLDAPDAAPYFGGFMWTLSHAATRRVAVDCTCHPRVNADERMLLDVFGLAQEARSFEALLVLRGLVTSGGARAALRSAEGVGAALARAGRHLLAPEAEMRRFAWAAEAAEAGRRVETLH